MISLRSILSGVAAATVYVVGTISVSAQPHPDKPIRLVVPQAAGGPSDTLARLTAHHMALELKQTVMVENVAGAGGTLGAKAAATAAPDGTTLLWASSGTLAITSSLYKKLSYDPAALVPVASVVKLPHVLVVPTSVPATTVRELVAYIKSNPGKVNFGAALGTPPHLMGALFKARAAVDLTFIPYKGAAPAISDLLAGQTQLTFDALTILHPLIVEGKLKPLAIVDTVRWPRLPDVPTMAESGFPDFTMVSFSGVLAPPGTPPAVVKRLNAAINDGLRSPARPRWRAKRAASAANL